jgi:putative transposase
MSYDPQRHHRRSIRLPAYDYAQPGAYFVTIVTHQRQCLFGEIVDGRAIMNERGKAVERQWLRSAQIRREMQLDAFVVMPSHIHGIVIIGDRTVNVGAHGRAPLHRAPRSVGSFIAGFKSAVTRCINETRGTPGLPVWQRNYYEHIIRDEGDLNRVRQYIIDNPAGWGDDPENPNNVGAGGRAPLRRATPQLERRPS